MRYWKCLQRILNIFKRVKCHEDSYIKWKIHAAIQIVSIGLHIYQIKKLIIFTDCVEIQERNDFN